MKRKLLLRTTACVATVLGMAAAPSQLAWSSDNVASPLGFAPRLAIPAPPGAHSVIADDLNGDGRLDLAMVAARMDTVAVMLGKTEGGFGTPREFAVGKAPKSVASGDFNKDGKRDLAVAEQNSNSIGILLGNGDGSFSARVGYDSCVGDHEILVADLNADAIEDIAVACWGNQNVGSVFIGVGDGTFKPRQDLAIGRSPHSVTAADFNGDGHPDLVFANHDSDSVSVALFDSGETFVLKPEIAVGRSPHSVRAADLDKDGHVDVVTANDAGESVSVLWGTADGFETHVELPALSVPKTVAVADVNGDGLVDVLVANTSYAMCCTAKGSLLRIYMNEGARKFAAPQDFFVGGNPFSLWIGDLDRDGRTDVVTANYGDQPTWMHHYPALAAVFDAPYGTRWGKLLRLAAIGALGLLIIAATWRRRRVPGLVAAFVVVAGYTALLVWIRSLNELYFVTLLMGS
jgi:hypothetical protein